MTFQLTDEQEKIIAAKQTMGSMVIEAGAGAGKTSTLKEIAKASGRGEKLVYVAYNRAIAADAKASFPRNTTCATAHSFAFRSVGVRYKDRLNAPRVSAKQTAAILGINGGVSWGDANYGPVKLALLAMGTVTKFCYSADTEITPRHVPWIPGAEVVLRRACRVRDTLCPQGMGGSHPDRGSAALSARHLPQAVGDVQPDASRLCHPA